MIMDKLQYDGPVVLAILDGVGLAPDTPGNAVSKARTTFLGKAAREYYHIALNASGEAVGLTPGQMGNSEVGHNTIGAGTIFKHGIARADEAINNGEVFTSDAWHGVINQVLKDGGHTLHFAGIFSDGGVHSHIAHLEKMIEQAYRDGVRKMRIHAVFDGRDVAPQSEPKFINRIETFAQKFTDADIKIACGGGRMVFVADRYENDWQMVARGWDAMVNGEADYYFKSANEAISILRRLNPEVQDQYLPPFVIVNEKDEPVGKIKEGDAVVYYDFRADRAIEISMAFTYWDFPYFNRGNFKPDQIYFAGLTEYNSDTHVPEHRLFQPVTIEKPLNKFLGEHGVSQFAISETVKFGHITYYFNGDSYEKAEGEEHQEIESYTEPFETRPWMKCAEITDAVLENLDKYKFVRVNFPGGDMVGHTADMEATIIAMESIDLSLARIAKKVDELGGVLIICADHGNAEELLDESGNKKTSHTTNKIPCIFYDNTENRNKYKIAGLEEPGLSNIASTLALFLGFDNYPESWDKPLISVQ